MNTIKEILKKFSEKNDLWNLTKIHGIECIQNYLKDNNNTESSNLKLDDFVFYKKNQSIIISPDSNNDDHFIIKTTYDLSLEIKTFRSGYYSLDVDQKGNIIDDWLYLDF
ncbi:hypothetical protein [Flavobacterium johnsoniae]|uniref:Uncharacterized protein n=1 Tax=Flavobacterium johnsoniae (strain ATCC 17061 / DSM 2064 / JCM 8514 / BCRC 14874 / CCUG 350202 / NBRC 14942 / NCIMB 11054 / UW101) TaxID=376686 RepID=A5FGP5_FLAJ1|nr:hypothetical protein [Flavobacterium johnsoniae]ABQ05621.1 hypothetical protein Fjoh_2594 [Flavobacterium johnsoniae UW101]OXG00106.1 hypothetical protein B0A63_10415 [Flavobacterium johnsoniae UW101]WQG82576.1 hypothetical protein SR927_05545 [Flavobacterium johnsoniae UW101]SHL52042.1 hypothetical protein SAMN05444146_3874 [Flavobacterium johnsoniae]